MAVRDPMKTIPWDTLDWATLDRLRDTFLSGAAARGNYWTSRDDVANYDYTFAQRIAWKWEAVLAELKLRGWTPPGGPLFDWGCGSGVASRCVVRGCGAERFTALRVFDRSTLAMDYAATRAREEFPELRVELAESRSAARRDRTHPMEFPFAVMETDAPGTLVLSHVLNELGDADRAEVLKFIARADAVLWVEPGTHTDSRALIAIREQVREQFHIIAPCTHQAACGMLAPENDHHWCHHFAPPAPGILADADWVRFAQRAGIDLRSVPYSFIVLERKSLREPMPGLLPDGWSRVIGAPRVYKGFARIFSCQAEGVRDLELQKRDAPEVFKAMSKGNSEPVYRWESQGNRICSVKALDAAKSGIAVRAEPATK